MCRDEDNIRYKVRAVMKTAYLMNYDYEQLGEARPTGGEADGKIIKDL